MNGKYRGRAAEIAFDPAQLLSLDITDMRPNNRRCALTNQKASINSSFMTPTEESMLSTHLRKNLPNEDLYSLHQELIDEPRTLVE